MLAFSVGVINVLVPANEAGGAEGYEEAALAGSSTSNQAAEVTNFSFFSLCFCFSLLDFDLLYHKPKKRATRAHFQP